MITEKEKRPEKAVKTVRYCPQCAQSLEVNRSLLNSYSLAKETMYYCFCHHCLWSGDILPD